MKFIHKSSVVAPSVIIEDDVYIGPNCTIGFPDYKYRRDDLPNKVLGPVKIGKSSKIMGNSVVCEHTTIGSNCILDYHSYIGSKSIVGNNVKVKFGGRIYSRVTIGNFNSISGFIGNDCIIGDYCIVQGNLIHTFKNVSYGIPEQAPVIENYVFIGMNAVIVGGITIKERCYIGSSTVVLETTKSGKLYVGNPAREIGDAPQPYTTPPWNMDKI